MLGGDFSQILPVVKQDNEFDVIEACLQDSYVGKIAVSSSFPEHATSRERP